MAVKTLTALDGTTNDQYYGGVLCRPANSAGGHEHKYGQ